MKSNQKEQDTQSKILLLLSMLFFLHTVEKVYIVVFSKHLLKFGFIYNLELVLQIVKIKEKFVKGFYHIPETSSFDVTLNSTGEE